MNRLILFISCTFLLLPDLLAQAKTDSVTNYIPLPFSETEVKNIVELIGGDLLTGNSANYKNVLNSFEKYDIIHLATHTDINEKIPLSSKFLLFRDSSESDNSLYLSQIYSMKLNAKMAVLSSCNTGTGKLEKGEGIMSLARAFTFAGCPSIVMSLWEIDDISTSEIMRDFYFGLKNCEPKDVALRNAKLKYLSKSNSKTAAPFFWGGTVPIGDQQSLVFASHNSILKYSLVLVFIILLSTASYFYFKRRKVIA